MFGLKIPQINLKNEPYTVALVAILISGFLVRVHGIQFGKPFLYHVDEWKLVNMAGHLMDLKNLGSATILNIGMYPPFFVYILALAFSVYGALGLLIGIFPSISALIESYRNDPFTFHLIGRYISAIMGTVTIYITYLIGKSVFNKKIGIIGALFLAFTFIHVRNSHYATVDIAATFFVSISLLFIFLIYSKGERKFYLWAGLFCAISVATKFTVALIVISFLIAHFLRSHKLGLTIKAAIFDRNLLWGLTVLMITFLIFCPFPFFNFYFFLNNTSKIASTVVSGRVGYFSGNGFFSYITGNQWSGFGHFARNSLSGGIGLHMMIVSIAGTALCFYEFSKKNLLFLSYPIIHFLALSLMSYKAMRNMLPIVPQLSLLSSFFIYSVITKVQFLKRRENISLVIFSTLCVVPMMVDSIRNNYNLTLKETRTIAKEWIEQNIPSGSRIGVESKRPQLYNTNPNFTIMGPRLNETNNKVRSYYLVDTGWFLFSYAPDELVEFNAIQEMLKQKVDYIILDDWTYGRFYLPQAIAEYPLKTSQRHKFYDWIRGTGSLVNKFEPTPGHSTGPVIEIYKLEK